MKQFYFTLLLSTLTFFASAQSNDSNTTTNVTARPIATTTSPTDPTNTEVGVTDGALNISLTGSASYTIPILVPPGINGVEPSISINYNSQRGLNGTAAKGWDIGGVSSITRIPATKFHDQKTDPVDFNSLDRFALDGQRLIVKNTTDVYGANGTVYETEYFSNTKVTSYGVHPDGAKYGPAYFIVEYPNGTKAYYGNSTDSRSVMEWSVTTVDNPQGIRIAYTYITASNTLYIDSIKYGGLTSTTPINEIKFGYGPRSSFNDSYVGGINVNRDKNLVSINVISSSVGFRNYFFMYEIQDMITFIIEKNGDNTKSYNPTIFNYGRNDGSDGIQYTQGNNKLDVGTIRSTINSTISGDFDADGNMDFILYPTTGASAKAKYWLYTNTSPSIPFSFSIPHDVGAFEEIFPVAYLNATNKLGSAQGWAVAKKTETNYTFTIYNYNYGLSSSSINTQYSKVVNFPLDIVDETCNATCLITNQVFRIFPKKIISGDFNGDGVTDVLAIDTRTLRKYCNENISTGRCTASNENVISTKVYFVDLKRDNTTNFLFYAGNISSELTATSKVEVGDFNGDGKSDIFIFALNYVKIYGLSDTNQLVLLYENTIADASIVLDKPILMGDYNGDGKTDFLIPRLFGSVNWYKYTSTGNSLLKEEIITGLVFSPNDSYNTYNYIPVDFNNDNKTDILVTRSKRNSADTLGLIAIDSYQNVNGSFPVTTGIARSGTQEQADINIYALPVYLPVHQQNLKNGTIGSTLQVAFLNENKIHFFTSASDLLQRYLLTNIRTGNGVEQAITYTPLNLLSRNTFYNIYTPSTGIASYPYFDIQIDPNLYVVSKIEQKSKDVYKKRLFGYYGAVSNFEGLGFMGFRSVTQTNWHDDNSKIFTDIYNNDISLRGANIETISAPYLSYPYPEALPPDFTTKSITTYNIVSDPPLQSNKVFKLKTTNVKASNTLSNTNSEVKDIVYDTNNNITSSTTVSYDGSTLAQTVKTDITYENPKTTPPNLLYISGRPLTNIQTVTADGHTMTISEKYTYNAKELLDTKEKFAIGTSTIKEAYEYDSYGNMTKQTITPTLPMLPRSTKYEYDITKRFVSKITDIDNLETSFVYDANGLLKKVTDPYLRSKSYTYDSWFRNLTVTDDLLKSVVTNVYSRSTEKTIVTTTVSAPSLTDSSVSEDTFDDLGRKIKSGTKDLNGNFSYVSYLYDIYDRNIKVSEPYIGATASVWNEVKFDDYGRNTQTNLFNGRTTSTSYTPASLKATFTDGLKAKTTTQNAAGNTISTTEDTGGDILYNYFGNGSLRKTKYNGVEIVMEQDGWGQKTKLSDPSAGTYNYTYNDLGELLTETIDGTGIVTTITRDPSNGKPTKKTIVDPKTNIEINYTYDGYLPLITTYTDYNEPSASQKTTTTITYDTSKRISTIVEEKGTNITKFTTTYTYDAYDRIVTETKKAEIGTKKSTVKIKNSYKNGDLYQISDDATGTVLWQTNTLNAKGQVVESQTGNGIKMTNTYDPTDGSLSKIQYDKTTVPVGNILTLTTVFDKNTDYLSSRINSAFANYAETFKYDDIGRLKEFTNRLGIQETQTYDASGKITGNNLGTYGYDTTKPYQNTSITLNPETAGYYANREGIFNDSMEDKMGWGASKVPNTNFFSYDVTKTPNAAGKTTLKLANTTTTEQYIYSDKWTSIDNAVPTQYTYSAWVYSDSPQAEIVLVMKDAAGNITTDNIVSNVTNKWTPITKTFLVPANIKKISIRLDNNGLGNIWYDDVEIRKTSDPTSVDRKLIVSYNAFKSPIQIEETNVDKISFLYNDNNQRSMMYYGGFQTDKSQRPLRKYYSADGSMEVKENTLTNTFEFVTYIGGDGYSAPIIAKSDGINTPNYLYLHRDYQGTILAVTDANGALVEKRLFDAWGTIIKVQDGAGNTLAGLTVLDRGYTGHEHLQSVGLINMNARLYDPMLHRFLQVDNYIQDPTSTQNYNQYGYVFNNPLLYTDPSGNFGEGGGSIGVGPGTGPGTSVDLHQLGKDTGITDWSRKNLNFKKWDYWRKEKISLKNIFGGGGNKNSTPAPAPNMSSYQNITENNLSNLNSTKYIIPIPNSDGLTVKQWEGLPLYKRIFVNRPGLIGGSGGLAFLTGEAEVLLLAKGGEKVYEVYHLVNKETQLVEYVGKTSQGILTRFEQHLLDPAKETWIHNVEPVLFKGGLNRFGAKYYEQSEILAYKLENLYNKINAVAEKYWIKYGIKY